MATEKNLHVILGDAQSIVFMRQDAILAAITRDRAVRFFDTATGKQIASLKDEDWQPAYIAATPDGKTLLVGRAQYSPVGTPLVGDVKVWDLERVLPAPNQAAMNLPPIGPIPAQDPLDAKVLFPDLARPVLHIDGKSGIRLTDTADLVDLNKDFTIETWVRFPVADRRMLFLAGDEAWPNMNPKVSVTRASGWVLRTRPGPKSGVAFDFTVACELADGKKSDWITTCGEPVEVFAGFQHLAVCRLADRITLYWNGRRHASLDCTGKQLVPSPTECFVGPRENGHANRFFAGDFAEFRLSFKRSLLQGILPAAETSP